MQKSSSSTLLPSYLANIYLSQVSNRNTRKRCEIWLDLTKKTPERRVFIVNFEHNSHFFLLLSLNMQMLPSFTVFQWLLWFRWTLSNICCMVICGESSFFSRIRRYTHDRINYGSIYSWKTLESQQQNHHISMLDFF